MKTFIFRRFFWKIKMEKILDTGSPTITTSTTHFRTKTVALCPSCRKPVKLISVSRTAEFYKTTLEEIYQLRDKLVLHPVHNIKGELMICEESLLGAFEQRKTQNLDSNYLLTFRNEALRT